ncbi:MAG TPA: amino acid adenylation domain-containing protein, partial [Longimicrobiaceae bacterium]|nr:amino acid adenylation domain-containing protein [Longimicrobiaceae bacterium]
MSTSRIIPAGLSAEEKRLLLKQLLRRKAGQPGRFPVSFAQRRLWLVHQMEPESAAYNIPLALRVRGPLDLGVLRRSLAEVVRRHAVLRTRFEAAEPEPVQVVSPSLGVGLPVVDLRALTESGRERELRRLAAAEADRPFDLAAGPLFRVTAVRLAEQEVVLLLTLHHVASDGWSMGVLVREVSELYAAFAAGLDSPLPELPMQYGDFAAWQRERLTGEVLEGQLAFWRDSLAGAPPLLELPTDRPRPATADARGGLHAFELPPALVPALRELARREEATPFMVLLSGWQALLARWSGQDDVVVGTPVAGRSRMEHEPLIGFFVNTLAIRARLSNAPTAREGVGRTRVAMLGALNHQDLPFERLVEELGVERSLGHAPVFQVTFALEAAGTEEPLRLGGARVEPLATRTRVIAFDLMLTLSESNGGISGMLEYRTDLWDGTTIERMAGHFRALLEGMASAPEARLAELELMDAAERRRVLEEWNATDRDYPAGSCVHDLFAAQAARTPDAVAVSWRGRPTTYAGLDQRSNRLAHALRRRGVGPETRVGVCLSRTPDLLVALLGVLRAGGAYVPLDPAYPSERLGYMLEDAAIDLVLTESRLAGRLPGGAAPLELDRLDLSAEPAVAPESGVGPENLSHVIFTSGSTGRPKGVMIRHASTVVLLHWLRENVSDEERASVLFSTSINFDVSVAEVFGTLCWGGKLVLAENALELATLDEPVVYASMVPSAAAELLRMGGIPASVRTLNLGGEALPAELARALYALGTVERVGNLYGPTEDTTYSTYSRVGPGAEQVHIGRPVANTRAYVLDAHLQPVPVGVVGELYLGGDGLARGYAGRPDLTAERFLPSPFGPAGSRMYRVMDRARWRPDGVLEYFGRTDFQVKVRGFRIELGEIEAVLARHPAVREAVAVVWEAAPGDRRIVAYVTGEDPSPAELRAHVGAHLPGYMVPSAMVALERFPLTPSGKVDRRALPAPERTADGTGYVGPGTPTEEILAGIWAEVLGTDRVGIHDDFFDLGGHSLLATRVVSRVRRALGVELPLRALFEAPTVAGLAGRVEALLREARGESAPPLERVSRDRPLPLSFAQQRLWFIDRLQPGSAAYNIPAALRLTGWLDVAALERSLTEVVRRHEALRTVFAADGEEPVQVVRDAAPAVVPVAELRHLTREAREAELRHLAVEEALRPFDLAAGPLLRTTLVRLGEEEWALLFTLHHIVSDGWSMGVLVREISELYAARTEGREPALPELPVQYADYAAWQRAWLSGGVLEAQLAYWRERLGGAPPLLELPTDRSRPLVQGDRAASLPFRLDADASRALRALARREGATLFMTLLAGWQLLLGRYAGVEDVSVGTPIAGRTRLETEGLIGFFVNTLVLRSDLSGDPSFGGLLARVREATLGAYAHQDLPFEKLVEELAPERSLAHAPLFQVLFSLQGATEEDTLRLGALHSEPLAVAAPPAKFDLDLALTDGGDQLRGELSFRTDLFDAATTERMLAHFGALLEGVAVDPERPLSRVPMLGAAERAQVLEAWNATAASYPRLPVHRLFRLQAQRTPDAVALSFR